MPINFEPLASVACDHRGEAYGELGFEEYLSVLSFLIGFDYDILRAAGWQVLSILHATILCPNCPTARSKNGFDMQEENHPL